MDAVETLHVVVGPARDSEAEPNPPDLCAPRGWSGQGRPSQAPVVALGWTGGVHSEFSPGAKHRSCASRGASRELGT